MPIKSRSALFFLYFLAAAHPAISQDVDPGEPLSAIDWLSDAVRAPLVLPNPQGDVSTNASPTSVVTTTLDAPNIDATGILPRSRMGLPADFWGNTPSSILQALIAKQRSDLPRPIVGFLKQLLLTELAAPIDSQGNGRLFLSRVDWYLSIGALDEARALLDRAGPRDNAALFARWFDASLLTGQEEQPCRFMLNTPDLAPTYPARVFCLARDGQWDAAALTLNTGRVLGLISAQEDALLARFLDPDLFEGAPLLPVPNRITPLNFRMHEAIGEPLSLGSLPNAFAYASLSENEGWKTRITAAERLVRTGAVSAQILTDLYSERSPAASGGVWDRVEAWQQLEAALREGDAKAVGFALPAFVRTTRRVGLDQGMADLLGPKLMSLDLPPAAKKEALRLSLLSETYETAAQSETFADIISPLLKGIATGADLPVEADGLTAQETAIVAALSGAEPPEASKRMIADGNLGQALLEAFQLLENGSRSDPSAIEQALSVFRALSLTDLTRRTALALLLERPA